MGLISVQASACQSPALLIVIVILILIFPETLSDLAISNPIPPSFFHAIGTENASKGPGFVVFWANPEPLLRVGKQTDEACKRMKENGMERTAMRANVDSASGLMILSAQPGRRERR
jgi:hypothetical protein